MKTIISILIIFLIVFVWLSAILEGQEMRTFNFSWEYIPKSNHVSHQKVLFSILQLGVDDSLLVKNIPADIREYSLTHEYYEGDTLYFCMRVFSYVEVPELALSERSNIMKWPKQKYQSDGIRTGTVVAKIDTTYPADVELRMTVNIIMKNYDNFEIDLENTLDVPITEFKFELDKGFFDWVNINGYSIERFCLTENKCNQDGVHDTYFTLAGYTILPNGEIKITGDIDESEDDGYLNPVKGKVSINGHSGILVKDNEGYKAEIRY